MPTEKNSVGEVQEAIRKGAITREYRADTKRVIQALNGLRSTEIMSYLQYMQHQYMAVSLLSPGLKTEFEAHATQELDHANRLAERIQQLGGVPVYDPKEISMKAASVGVEPEQVATLTEMVVEDLLLERQQIEVYSALIREIGDQDNPARAARHTCGYGKTRQRIGRLPQKNCGYTLINWRLPMDLIYRQHLQRRIFLWLKS
jgi:bacterioferritin